MFDMYGDSDQYLFEILAVVIILISISFVRGSYQRSSKRDFSYISVSNKLVYPIR